MLRMNSYLCILRPKTAIPINNLLALHIFTCVKCAGLNLLHQYIQ